MADSGRAMFSRDFPWGGRRRRTKATRPPAIIAAAPMRYPIVRAGTGPGSDCPGADQAAEQIGGHDRRAPWEMAKKNEMGLAAQLQREDLAHREVGRRQAPAEAKKKMTHQENSLRGGVEDAEASKAQAEANSSTPDPTYVGADHLSATECCRTSGPSTIGADRVADRERKEVVPRVIGRGTL